MDHTKLHALFHGTPSYIDKYIYTYIYIYIYIHRVHHTTSTRGKEFLKYTTTTKLKPF
jgi:hypothetical protein